MARIYNDALREDAARAVMKFQGFVYNSEGRLLDEAAAGNPRVRAWVEQGDAVLAVVFPRKGRRS